MSLLSIEGESTIEIAPEDDFKTFLQKAKSTLGYDFDISRITDNQNVLLTDNLLDFLINKNLEAASLCRLVPLDEGEDDAEVIYVLNENPDDKKTEDRQSTTPEDCHMCKTSIENELLKSYIYESKILNLIRQNDRSVRNLPKVICDRCLEENYSKVLKNSSVLCDDEVLVVKCKVQAVYKKKNVKKEKEDDIFALTNKICSKSDDSESEAWIIQSGETWPEGLPKLSSSTPVYDASNITIKKPLTCSNCKNNFASLDLLSNHICKPATGKYVCRECGLRFYSKIRLQFHIRHFHSSRASGYLTCSQCPGCIFDTEDALFNHVNFKHPREKTHVCPHEGCGKSFQLKATLTSHMKSHSDERGHICKECGKQFLDKQTLNEHSVVHMKVKPFQCHICLKYLNRKSRLRVHLKTHKSAPVFAKVLVCKSCDLAFKDGREAQEHFKAYGVCPDSFNDEETLDVTPESFQPTRRNLNEQLVENEMLAGLDDGFRGFVKIVYIDKVYRCEFCENLYSVADSLNLHRSYHEPSAKPYTCRVCGASFPTYSQCTTHKTTHGAFRSDKLEDEALQDDFPVIKHFLCEVCGKSFFLWTYLHVHRKQRHPEEPLHYPCKTCDEVFTTRWGIAHHNKKYHAKPDIPVPMDKITIADSSALHMCKVCGIHVKTKALLRLHTKNAHDKKKPVRKFSDKCLCKICNKHFESPFCLKVHLKIHKPDDAIGKHHCKKCGKNFTHAAGLTSHDRRVHKRETNYTCVYCKKNFYNSCDLKYHVRRHTGERPYSCGECGHAFRTKGMRNEHMRIHTEERPYPCEVCGLSFKRSYALKNHRIIHTGEKRFKCPHENCTERFRLQSNLKSHIKQDHKPDSEIVVFNNEEAESFLLDNSSSDRLLAFNSEIVDSAECIMIENDGQILAELLDSGIFRPGETLLLQDDTKFIVSTGNEVIGELIDNGENYIIKVEDNERDNTSELHFSDSYPSVEFIGDWQEVNGEDYYVEEVQGDKVIQGETSDSQAFEDLFSVVNNNID